MIKSRSEIPERVGPIRIDLTGPMGNPHYLIGLAGNWGKQIGFPSEEIEAIKTEMMSGDYEHLLEVFDRHFGMLADLYR